MQCTFTTSSLVLYSNRYRSIANNLVASYLISSVGHNDHKEERFNEET